MVKMQKKAGGGMLVRVDVNEEKSEGVPVGCGGVARVDVNEELKLL